jgi:hypothetical protein
MTVTMTVTEREGSFEIGANHNDWDFPVAFDLCIRAQLLSNVFVAMISRSAKPNLALNCMSCAVCWRAAGCSWTQYLMCSRQGGVLRMQAMEPLVGFLATTALASRTVSNLMMQLITVKVEYTMVELRRDCC